MSSFVVLLSLFLFISFSISAAQQTTSSAQYILQVSSNLECDQLIIELTSQSNDADFTFVYKDNAFAALQLPSGSYSYTNITCAQGNEEKQSFENLLTDLPAFSLLAGKKYFAGKLIVKKQSDEQTDTLPDVLENCTNIISNARGESSSECRDGAGVKTTIPKRQSIQVFAPILDDEYVNQIRNALKVDKADLLYMPLVPTNN